MVMMVQVDPNMPKGRIRAFKHQIREADFRRKMHTDSQFKCPLDTQKPRRYWSLLSEIYTNKKVTA